ncbi:MAG TPA: CHRD domain-containing protein [Chitinophagaceae bacterium]|nr:CHRD domain-containing protein [Chitinophagaceae bacterium]
MKKFYITLCVLCLLIGCKKETRRIMKDDTSVQQLSDQATQQRGGRPFEVTLTGAAEVPGPGDPDGTGTATLRLNQGQGTISFEIHVSDITLPATGAHIHVGTAAASGPVVVGLTPPDATGHSSGEVSVDPDLIKAIRQNPENYYVNVHTLPLYGAGAIRGQLSK